ncbi:unnamed protein product [Orchesella dallaii]|uniref:Uncharacterized protein n=1 Tax=Orchesella dallaii TaxID=48710 RepID=A0ABP1RRX7_9HEXA
MRCKRRAAYRPKRFTGRSHGKRWKDIVAANKEYEAQLEKERERLQLLNQTENVSATEARRLNRLESNDAEGRSQLSQSESVNVTATRASEPQENVRRDVETCQIKIEDSGGDSGSEVQFLGEVEGQSGEDERINMLDWNRIENFQRFLDSLPPYPAGTPNERRAHENSVEPVAHCSTTFLPPPNLNPTTSVSSVNFNDAAASQVNTVEAGRKYNEQLGYNNMQLQNWVSEVVSQTVGKLTLELRKQGREMQTTLKTGQDETVGSLNQIIERLDALNEVRDWQDTVAELPRTVVQSRQVDRAGMSDRMEGNNQYGSNEQRYRSPPISLPSYKFPKRQGQFKRKASLKKLSKETTLRQALLTNEAGDITVGGTTSTPQTAIQASSIPPPTMSESSYKVLRNRSVKKTVERKRKRSNTGLVRFVNEGPPASVIVEFDGGQRQRQSTTQNSASLPRPRNSRELI